MSASPQQTSATSIRPASHSGPARLLLIVVASVFIAEAIVMAVMSERHPITTLLAASLDTVLVFPALYFFVLRPLQEFLAERQKAETALKENEGLLREVLEALPLGVWILDRQGNIVQANPAGVELWGGVRFVGIEDFGQYKGWWLDNGKRIQPQEWPAVRAISKGEASDGEEIEIETFDGVRKIIQSSAVPLLSANGVVAGAVVVSRDITRRKQNERQIQRSNRELESLNAVSMVLGSSLEMSELLQSLRESMTAQGNFPAGIIYSYDAAGRQLELELSWGLTAPSLPPGSRLPVDSYPCREAIQTKRVCVWTPAQVRCADQQAEIGIVYPPSCEERACIPLVAQGEIQGVMELAGPAKMEDAGSGNRRYLEAIGQMMGIAIHNARLYAGEQKARRTAEILRQAGLALTRSLDMSVVMDEVLDVMGRLVPYDCASIILVEDADHLVVHAARGCGCPERVGGRIAFDRDKNEPLEQMLSSREGKVLTEVSGELTRKLTPCHLTTRSWMGVPFVAGEQVIGLCGMGNEQPRFYTAEHMQLAEALASQAAVAVQNAWLFAQLRDSREHLQTLSRRLVEVQENERGYVARELHDEAGQVLASLILGLRMLGRQAHEPEAVISGVEELKGMVDGVLENLHRLAVNLRPASLDHLGLEIALRQHLETIADRNNLTAQMETVGMDLRLPKDIEVALYRIVQEALANVVRHSQATRVDLLLKRDGDKVVAVVEDNGVGFSEEQALSSGRMGLFGMRERAEMLGGSLAIECGRSGGTTVLVEVPCGNSHRHS